MRNIMNRAHQHTVKFNPRFADSYCKAEIDNSLQYVDGILRCANQAFPEGMVYEGYTRCSPDSTYELFLRKAKTDIRFVNDLSRTDVFMCQFKLSFQGQPLEPTYLYLPFVDQHGFMTIRDKPFYIKPVVADPLISITTDGLFIPLNQTKMTTHPRYHYLVIDNVFKQVKIFETTIHHSLSALRKKANKLTKQRITPNVLYQVCYRGVTQTLAKQYSCDVVVGMGKTINTDTHPKKDWVIYESANDARFLQMGEPSYDEEGKLLIIKHGVTFAIKRSQHSKAAESAIAALMYVLDLLPEVDSVEDLDDPTWWKLKLGQIILGTEEDHRTLMKKMQSHFKAIDSYIDPMAINLLKADGIFITDMDDYLGWGVHEYDNYVNGNKLPISSMYGKLLMVNRYIFQVIRSQVFQAIYNLRQKSPDKLTPRVISTVLASHLKPNLIAQINNNFPNVVPVMSASDSRLLKTGIEVMPQDAMRAKKKEQQPSMLYDPKWKMDVSRIDAGGFASMSKGEPVGKDTVTPCIEIDSNGMIIPQKRFEKLLTKTAYYLTVDGE